MTDCADIAVAILAAGRASRFGSDKLMMPVKGVPLGTRIATTIAPMDFGWHFAICAVDSPIAEHYADLGFNIVENDKPESGQAHSLHLAVKATMATTARSLLVTLADMPFVSRDHLAAVARTGNLTASTNGRSPMPPALFPREYWPALLSTKGDAGARSLLQAAQLVFAPPDELRDIDVAADLPRPRSV
jgi:molybdenum cofactor cytidylyltransferase